MIWAYLAHLSYNMWIDRVAPELEGMKYITYRPWLRCERSMWDYLTSRLQETGFNMLIIDVGDGVKYESHPEIAVANAWSTGELRQEVKRLREMGLEPIPKLNFSTCHDAWMGAYSHMVSSPLYYEVCADLIAECCDIFDSPRLFHLGMDEENIENHRHHQHVVIRQYDLWWNDLGFLFDCVQRSGARPWVWADQMWQHEAEYLERMPKSVLQSNWYYGADFGPDIAAANAYLKLEEHGFDQVPAASNWTTPENFDKTVEFCSRSIAPERLLGFMQTVWRPTLEEVRDRHDEAVLMAAEAIRKQGPASA